MTTPRFAVVGHPNKGKSSLVATLARDLSVGIGPEPGTTRRARPFPMQVDGALLYTLIDTPGFQRSRAVLAWLKQAETHADSRPAAVARFVREHADDDRFHDECELLRPVVEGAGIIYVVDGAAPYGPEYEAEMEILRWTGQPSMAIINPIGEPRFVEPWRNALGQFFRVVRVVDVLQAPFDQQIDLLKAFSHLRDDWRSSLERAVGALQEQRRRQREDAARVIAEMIEAALTYQECKDIPKGTPTREPSAALEQSYRGRLRQIEREARSAVEEVFGYTGIERSETDLELLESDLLAKDTWLLFGLKTRDLVALGAVGGAVAGGVVDASLMGASFLTGTVLGGIAGGAAGYFSAGKLADVKVLSRPLGGLRLRCGPTRNVQFPFVLLGRARLHYALVSARTHAQRQALVVEGGTPVPALGEAEKRTLAALFKRLGRRPGSGERRAQDLQTLAETIAALLPH